MRVATPGRLRRLLRRERHLMRKGSGPPLRAHSACGVGIEGPAERMLECHGARLLLLHG